ncbi:hypothetical protein HPB50_014247 [Hyalomma asiaticum]|uniref:Uncharacterized protein n=1 Tax=Hyalomma asiaticum TaxID=266040 RepID=A0ACB7S133_HYAAI|nr:hypothetical protein HPB50_014247 [Hyalomma asiaticum]
MWKTKEDGEMDANIRNGIKKAWVFLYSTNEERPKFLGTNNTFNEIVKAHQSAPAARPSSSKAGWCILEFLGCEPPMVADKKIQTPLQLREQITV